MCDTTVFVSGDCNGSHNFVKELLTKHNVAYHEINVDWCPGNREAMIQLSNKDDERKSIRPSSLTSSSSKHPSLTATMLHRNTSLSTNYYKHYHHHCHNPRNNDGIDEHRALTRIPTGKKKEEEEEEEGRTQPQSQRVTSNNNNNNNQLDCCPNNQLENSSLDRTRIYDIIHFDAHTHSPHTHTTTTTITQLTRDLLQYLPRRKLSLRRLRRLRRRRPKKIRNHPNTYIPPCFTGTDVLQTLSQHYHIFFSSSSSSSDRCFAFAQKLLRLGIVQPIDIDIDMMDMGNDSSSSFSSSSRKFNPHGRYCLQPLRSPNILNTFRVYTPDIRRRFYPDDHPFSTLSALIRCLKDVLSSVVTDDSTSTTGGGGGGGILHNHNSHNNNNNNNNIRDVVRTHVGFRYFEESVCLLQLMDLDRIIMNDDDSTTIRKTFFLNVYQLLNTHAWIKFGSYGSSPHYHHHHHHHRTKKKTPWDDVAYDIGGYIFRLDELYHGILRCNANHPLTHQPIFHESDPRRRFVLENEDVRIHFAVQQQTTDQHHHHHHQQQQQQLPTTLCDYRVDTIDEELRMAAERYCQSNDRVVIRPKENRVVLPKFMRLMLEHDTIQGDDHRLLESLIEFLRLDHRRQHDLRTMLDYDRTHSHPHTHTHHAKKLVVKFKHTPSSSSRTGTTATLFKLRQFKKLFQHPTTACYRCRNNNAVEQVSSKQPQPQPQQQQQQQQQQPLDEIHAYDEAALLELHIDDTHDWDTLSALSTSTNRRTNGCLPSKHGGEQTVGGIPLLLPSLGDSSGLYTFQDDESAGSKLDAGQPGSVTDHCGFTQLESEEEEEGKQEEQTVPSRDGGEESRAVTDCSSSSSSFDFVSKNERSALCHDEKQCTNEKNHRENDADDSHTCQKHSLRKIPSFFSYADIPDDYSLKTRSILDSTSHTNLKNSTSNATSQMTGTKAERLILKDLSNKSSKDDMEIESLCFSEDHSMVTKSTHMSFDISSRADLSTLCQEEGESKAKTFGMETEESIHAVVHGKQVPPPKR